MAPGCPSLTKAPGCPSLVGIWVATPTGGSCPWVYRLGVVKKEPAIVSLQNQFQSAWSVILSNVKCDQVLCFENYPWQPFCDLIKCAKRKKEGCGGVGRGLKKNQNISIASFFELDWSYWHLAEWLPLWGMYIEKRKGRKGEGGGLLMGSSLALAFSDIEMIPIQINHVSICL